MVDVAVIILIDSSASMFGAGMEALLDGYYHLRHLLQKAEADGVDVAVTLASYEHDIKIHGHNIQPNALPTLETLPAEGPTYLGRALAQAKQWIEMDYSEAQRAWVFLLTDGYGNDLWQAQVNALRQSNVPSYLVGMFHQGRGLGEIPQADYQFDLRKHEPLTDIFQDLMQ